MKEIKQIIELYSRFANLKGALLTVIKVEGSSYRRVGARMLMLENGEWIGGISGGCLEADALKKAQQAIFNGKPRTIIYDTTNDDPLEIGVGLGCNGIIHILITPLENFEANQVQILKSTIGKRTPTIIKTSLNTESLGDLEIISETKKQQNSLLEIVKPAIRFVIFGSNHDVEPLVKIANEIGWEVVLVANLNKIKPSIKVLCFEIFEKGKFPELDEFSVAISMCHDFETDFQNLKELILQPIKYIGLLGPKKRFDKMEATIQLSKNEHFEKAKQHIYAPAGLDIGAETPEEIALSICSEIKTVLNKRAPGFLRDRELAIYG